MNGLGEVVGGEVERKWIKENLKKDTLFYLKNYAEVL